MAATPKSLIASAKSIASADQIAGASIGQISRRRRGPARAVHPGGVLEFLTEAGSPAVTAR